MSDNLKIILVGDAAVGKTTFLKYYETKKEQKDGSYKATIGASNSKFVKMLKDDKGNDKEYVIAVWDTAGSEQYRSLQPLYARNANAAFVLCAYDSKDSLLALPEWINTVKKETPDCIIYLIANKNDLETKEFTFDEFDQFANDNSIDYYSEVSAKLGTGVTNAFDSIFELAAKQLVSKPDILEENATVDINKENETNNKKRGCC